MRLLFLFAALVVVAVGCGGEQETATETEVLTETVPPAETAETETGAADEDGLAQECDNPQDGYSVRFPDDWHTNSGDVTARCSYFHPEAFEVPEAQEFFDVAISISREPVPFERVTGDDPSVRVVTSEETEVAGRRALRRETEATGEGLLPAGVRTYQYVVAGERETVIASTYDVGELDYERNRDVLDRMMQTLRFE